MSAVLRVDVEELAGLTRAMGAAQSAMARTLADLERDLGPMREAWTGQAADAYAGAQHRWRISMVRMVTALAAATGLLAESEQALARTEAAIAGQWPG